LKTFANFVPKLYRWEVSERNYMRCNELTRLDQILIKGRKKAIRKKLPETEGKIFPILG